MQQATLDRIREEAHSLKPLRTLLTFLASVLFALGWVASRTLGVIWAGLAWAYAAVIVGWKSGTGKGEV